MTGRADPRRVVQILRDPRPGMARFYPGLLSDRDVEDLAQFIDGWNSATSSSSR